ncbi:MAG: type I DNA topoisomerase [Patescibacteria group bacterium]|nr:type I DNA topoisomerase [Patescibacteria group bacterium]
MKLLIVESPAKAKTIEKYLGKEYRVMASVGHIRDLPKSNKDAVDIEGGFTPRYVIVPGKAEVMKRIEEAAEKADEVLLATDPDREGEAIAWHLAEIIKGDKKLKAPLRRVSYQEITKEAIEEALKHPRDIDQNLRRAQEARRVLDRLVGYDLSGLIWKKVRYGLSAGRVQSPALRILMEREREIRAFKPERFFVITADFETPKKKTFMATCSVEPNEEKEAKDIVEKGKKAAWKIADLTASPVKRSPRPPFTTSTLQQAASSRLGYSPSRTMRAAQKLYEAGAITYMRTDSVTLSGQALGSISAFVKKKYGEKYLEVRAYKTKAKNAQEAHEAIRPTNISALRAGSADDESRLYQLIHARTLASQMADAIMTRTKIVATAEGVPEFTATGSTIAFDGWLAADTAAKGEDVILPEVTAGDALKLEKINSEEKFTQPPPRYTEAGLVKELEKRGIGRPSTYASIIKTIVDRGYVLKEGRSLQVTPTGEVVSTFLENNFEKYVSDSFTAEMEDELDQIAIGERGYSETLTEFYKPFSKDVAAKENIEKLTNLGDAPAEFLCPVCGSSMVMKLGRGGVFMSCSRFPECKGSRTETGDVIKDAEPIGTHPETGNPIFVKTGKFGPYVEMPESAENPASAEAEKKGKRKSKAKKPKAKRASIPKDINPSEITIPQAVKLLSLPRELGVHDESGKPITASIGKFGPFIVHDGDFRSLKGKDDPYLITLERAKEILKEPKKNRPGAPVISREVGEHPKTKKRIYLYKSKSGYFLKKGFKRVSVPDNMADVLTPAEAIDILKAA